MNSPMEDSTIIEGATVEITGANIGQQYIKIRKDDLLIEGTLKVCTTQGSKRLEDYGKED